MSNYISIKDVLSRIMIHPLLQTVTLDQAAMYTMDFIKLMGLPIEFEEKFTELTPTEHRVQMPCDYTSLISLRDKDTRVNYRYATDVFHISNTAPNNYSDYTYKLKGNVLYLSQDNPVEIMYRAVPTDSNGFPMIVDNAEYIRALEAYIKKQVFTILYDLKEIEQGPYVQACQDYAFAAGACQAEANRISVDQMESLKNIITAMFVPNHHTNGFFNLGDESKLKTT